MISQLINPIKSLVYQPDRVSRNFRKFDVKRGFHDYHERCKKAFKRDISFPEQSPVVSSGFEYLDVLDPEEAGNLVTRLEDQHSVGTVKKETPGLLGFKDIDEKFRCEILQSILTPEVDRRIAAYFESEYLVLWMTLGATGSSATEEVVSFKWHCDKGPSKHLKLMVYLNASDEHGGNTEFISLSDSHKLGRKGYIFDRSSRRTNDTGYLSRLIGEEIETTMEQLGAGSGILFQPSRVLHRGIAPNRGIRYTVTLCLLPSPVFWQQAYDRGLLRDLNHDDLWPSHAANLEQLVLA